MSVFLVLLAALSGIVVLTSWVAWRRSVHRRISTNEYTSNTGVAMADVLCESFEAVNTCLCVPLVFAIYVVGMRWRVDTWSEFYGRACKHLELDCDCLHPRGHQYSPLTPSPQDDQPLVPLTPSQ